MDGQLFKIESFYEAREKEATERLRMLRQQLNIMGNQRIQEVLVARALTHTSNADKGKESNGAGNGFKGSFLKNPMKGLSHFGKNSQALPHLTTPALHPNDPESVLRRRDFTRRPEFAMHNTPEVPYRSAKRKLKVALLEFYRGLELLRSYAFLNRTAFRKINKKYDKVAVEGPTMWYMTEKVNKAWFVQSEVVDDLMVTVEDLYTRYFERGNHKIAVSKLRHVVRKSGDYSPNTFRVGLTLMGGALFAIQALVYAEQHVRHEDSLTRTRTTYLLQVKFLSHFLTRNEY